MYYGSHALFDSVQVIASEEIHLECMRADEISRADEGLCAVAYTMVQALYLNKERKFLQSRS